MPDNEFVSPAEQADALNPRVGAGTPADAPYTTGEKSWHPTRKWIAAQVIALGALATSAVESGWDTTETVLLIGIIVQGGITWLLPNVDAPGGVPLKHTKM